MSRGYQILTVFVIAVGTAAGGFWYGKHTSAALPEDSATTQAADNDKPVASVKTIVLTQSTLSPTHMAFGVVATAASDLRTVSVPFECRVTRILAAADTTAGKDDELIDVEASPDTAIAFQDAKNTLAIATADVKQAEARLNNHLATNQEISTARAAVQSAQLKFDSLNQRGVGVPQKLKASAAGVVSKVDVQQGQIVAAGSPLIELADATQHTAVLQADPADLPVLSVGAQIQLHSPDLADLPPVTGTVRSVAQRVDPVTRTIAITVTLPVETNWRLGSAVVAQFSAGQAKGWIVPRDAALPGDDGTFELFTVKDGKAVHHTVKLGLEDAGFVQVLSEELHEGDVVIAQGNAEVEDGMAVLIDAATTEPASTEPPTTLPATTAPASIVPATSPSASSAGAAL